MLKYNSMLDVTPSSGGKVRTRQIESADLGKLATLLAQGFKRSSCQNWMEIFNQLTERSSPVGFPKYGYLMECEDALVGGIIVISSATKAEDGALIVRSNLSSWYVLPAYRSYASLLVSRTLKNKDVTYVNVSPAPHTLPILGAQGFTQFSSGQFLILANPLGNSGDAHINAVTSAGFTPPGLKMLEQDLLREHARYGCISLVCTNRDGAHPFVFRPRLVKGFVPCAQLIYCRNITEFVRVFKPIGRFLARSGKPIIMIDSNNRIPNLPGVYISGISPKYCKGPVAPRVGDLAYTETAMFGV
jgi:hypothetical protein